MSKIGIHNRRPIKKAAITACLFLLLPASIHSQDLDFDASVLAAYHSALNIDPAAAFRKIPEETAVTETYVTSFAEAVELLVTEDPTKFGQYEERFLKRLDKNIKGSPRDYQFLQAEIRLQWAFVYLKFGHELDAALRLREAYQIVQTCKSKFPEYIPIRKTSGLLQVIVGSVPDKYSWVLSLLNMSGSVSAGLAELHGVATSKSPLAREAKVLHALVKGFILSRPAEALTEMEQILADHRGNRLALFLGASLALKNASNEVAIGMLKELSQDTTGVPLYYADYLRGEAFLHKGDYLNSISAYRWFIGHQPGQNYIKDAYYKIGLCYWLNGNENDALAVFDEAREKGKEVTEADKSAARSLSDEKPPNVKLSKIRYLTDGGYYKEAEQLLAGIRSLDLDGPKDDAEYYYRKARLSHKLNRPDVIELYLETIRMTGQENWYFAPNACLQLGYIYQSQNRVKEATEYFQRALSYRRHEYKNSIDSKARSALAQLGRM
ncbi:MAG TPA: tetratricopeptide repeat protein [Chryseosolibacter sp.]|nr:tetratricopeptide repeat protein [Chryseosolibacter sp.]